MKYREKIELWAYCKRQRLRGEATDEVIKVGQTFADIKKVSTRLDTGGFAYRYKIIMRNPHIGFSFLVFDQKKLSITDFPDLILNDREIKLYATSTPFNNMESEERLNFIENGVWNDEGKFYDISSIDE